MKTKYYFFNVSSFFYCCLMFFIIVICEAFANSILGDVDIFDINEIDSSINIGVESDCDVEKKDVTIEQVGCIKGADVPLNCIFNKVFTQNYEKESLYAVVSVSNLSNETIIVWSDELFAYTYSCLGFYKTLEIKKGETFLLFFKFDEDIVYIHVQDSKDDDVMHLVQLRQDMSIFQWNDIEPSSMRNAVLEIMQTQSSDEQSSESVDLQLAIKIKGQFPVILFSAESKQDSNFYPVKLVVPHREEQYVIDFLSRYAYKSHDSFLLLPGERIISDISYVMKTELLNKKKIFIQVLPEELRNLFLQAYWSDDFFSAPFKIK